MNIPGSYYDFSVTAKTVGNWGAVSRRVRHIAMSTPAARAIIRNTAERSKDRIKSNILRQAYSDWPALSEETLKRKRSEGSDLRKLIEHREYVKAIRVIPMGPNQWGVGVLKTAVDPDDKRRSLAEIGLFHEYGTKKMKARPHWRREYAQFQQELMANLVVLMRRRVRGQR